MDWVHSWNRQGSIVWEFVTVDFAERGTMGQRNDALACGTGTKDKRYLAANSLCRAWASPWNAAVRAGEWVQ